MSRPTANTLNFRDQASQMLSVIEDSLDEGKEEQALELLILKFKTLYDQGVSSGRLYEREGIYPYQSLQSEDDF